ncbi:MAG: phospholipase D-like domain-containing protein [Wenzhouxiangella sp.]|nr:phospholipase D-like domain-containing protein [Wenzhouxiangella sp.]
MPARKLPPWRWTLLALLSLWLAVAAWNLWKPLPDGLNFTGPEREVAAMEFLTDLAWVDESGQRQTEQQIFQRKLELINQAERLIVADLFLFNEFAGDPDGDDLQPLAGALTEALIERKNERPGLRIIFITDPINTLYGGIESPHLNALRSAGIDVVITELDDLRDSNPLWTATWRLCCRWFGNSSNGGWLANPVGEQKVGLRTWLRVANFKANHRKTLIVDRGANWSALVTSANPHDASSAHGNTALVVTGLTAMDVLETERAVVAFSSPGLRWPEVEASPGDSSSGLQARVLTEAAIRDGVIAAVDEAGPGSRVDLAMFYLSHRGVIRALARASRRGAQVRLLLDPNEHAFGRRKNGVPNRPVAAELRGHDIEIRWCHTTAEQCHSKQLLVRHRDGSARLISGSANYTRRNLDNFNPETVLELFGPADAATMGAASAWFEMRWTNADGRSFSLDYDHYADEHWFRYWQYRFMEATGLSTF